MFAALLDKISISSGKYCVITLKYAHLFLECLVFDGQITIFAIITPKKISDMKRLLLSLFLAAAGVSASAMNYADAREYAYFLTDKMAYELNLTPAQYDQVYQVNLDYFLSVN